ncbi:MAG: hypothetical protein MZV64_26415 [Ignavibacteriales bacterium]|nr:hypothetical protein [Ignavibacteriales bacterium]
MKMKKIVIIKPDLSDIVNKISYFYKNPELLKSICEKGNLKIKHLYNYENQIKPRVELLKNELSKINEHKVINIQNPKFLLKTKIGKNKKLQILITNNIDNFDNNKYTLNLNLNKRKKLQIRIT